MLRELPRRFGRTVLLLYAGGAAVGMALLVVVLVTDLSFQTATARDNLLIETQTRSHYFGRELGLLASELRRLGLRSEVNLLDENLAPEQSLLRLSHEKSAFFNVGVAIVDKDGKALWSVPSDFLPAGMDVSSQRWFVSAPRANDVEIWPQSVESRHESLVYLVAPVVRNGGFSGALVGAIDLVGRDLDPAAAIADGAVTVLASREGKVVYPASPPSFALEPAWPLAFAQLSWQPFVTRIWLSDQWYVVTGDPVQATTLIYLSVVPETRLEAPARTRLVSRLALGVSAALIPLAILVVVLRRTVRVFLVAQEAAARDQRLRHIGEAANLIAHEIKNSLNGMQVGFDLVTRGDGQATKKERTVIALKSEMSRLSNFTTRLLSFAKGVSPRTGEMDLAAFVRRVLELFEEQAAEAGVALDVAAPAELRVRADSGLVHVLIANLVANAIDAVSGRPGARIAVDVTREGNLARVSVSDNGPGVPAELARSLFEPFVTGKPSGTGIGLALSRKIAEAHGGSLVLLPGPGASFLFTLPIRSQA